VQPGRLSPGLARKQRQQPKRQEGQQVKHGHGHMMMVVVDDDDDVRCFPRK